MTLSTLECDFFFIANFAFAGVSDIIATQITRFTFFFYRTFVHLMTDNNYKLLYEQYMRTSCQPKMSV